jgi:transglutaminase-like putative cysteine protease
MERIFIRSLYALAFLLGSLTYAESRFHIEREYTIANTSPTQTMRTTVTLPAVEPYINSRIVEAKHEPEPDSIKKLNASADTMTYKLEIPPGQSKTIRSTWMVELKDTDTAALQPTQLTAEERKMYTAPAKMIESSDSRIVQLAKELRAGAIDDMAFARNVYAAVKSRMKPQGFGTENRGALYAYLHGTGDCTEYAAFMVALARAGGLPARINTVLSMQKDGKSRFDNHNNAEIYVTDRWVPAEPFFGINALGRLTATEIILRRGLASGPMFAFSSSVAGSMKKYRDVKMTGFRWQRLK